MFLLKNKSERLSVNNDFIEIQEKQFKPWGFWATVGFCVCIAIVGVGITVIISGTEGLLKPMYNGLRFLTTRLIMDPLVIALCILFAHLRKGISFQEYLGLKRVRVSQMLLWCAITAAVVVCMELYELAIGESTTRDNVITMFKTAGYLPLLWLAVVVLAPVAEEISFRGFVFKGFNEAMGPVLTVVLLSFIFAILHFQHSLIGKALVFVMGVLFCVARIRTGSVYVPIAMHMVTNLVGMLHIWYWFAHG